MLQPQPLFTQSRAPSLASVRVQSIDVLRAATMLLMIFVNDLWSLKAIPTWLEHVPNGADGIGLADVVFPAFLFIVGMSLPLAINYRRQQGDSDMALVGHVINRSIALLLMGVFLVNGESINEKASGMKDAVWYLLSATAFILLWNTYPKTVSAKLIIVSKVLGMSVLVMLAIVYRGGDGRITYFATHWWGILGLIGWSYLAAALVTVFARNRLPILVLTWVGFGVLSMIAKANLLPKAVHIIPGAISGGTLVGLTMGGVVISTLFLAFRKQANNQKMTLVFVAVSVVLIGLSVYTRTFWGLSKLGETPAWLFLCSAFTILTFTAIYWLVDVAGKANWFAFIKPAGTDTLLCYLIPYFAYSGMDLLNLHLPDVMLIGGVGLLKSFLFALLCAWFTGRLNKIGMRLKL